MREAHACNVLSQFFVGVMGGSADDIFDTLGSFDDLLDRYSCGDRVAHSVVVEYTQNLSGASEWREVSKAEEIVKQART